MRLVSFFKTHGEHMGSGGGLESLCVDLAGLWE